MELSLFGKLIKTTHLLLFLHQFETPNPSSRNQQLHQTHPSLWQFDQEMGFDFARFMFILTTNPLFLPLKSLCEYNFNCSLYYWSTMILKLFSLIIFYLMYVRRITCLKICENIGHLI